METSMFEFNRLSKLRATYFPNKNIRKLKLEPLLSAFADLIESMPSMEYNTSGEYKRLDLLHNTCSFDTKCLWYRKRRWKKIYNNA